MAQKQGNLLVKLVLLVFYFTIIILAPGIFITSLLSYLLSFGTGGTWFSVVFFCALLLFFLFTKFKEKFHVYYGGLAVAIFVGVFVIAFVLNYFEIENDIAIRFWNTVERMFPFFFN